MASVVSQTQPQWEKKKKNNRSEFDIKPDGPFAVASGNKIVFCTHKGGGVAVYDEKDDSMQLMAPYPKDQQPGTYHTYCHHPPSNQIFIFYYKDIFIYNMSSKQWRKEQSEIETRAACSCLCIKDHIHIFGSSTHHLIYSVEQHKMYASGLRFEHSSECLRSVAHSHSEDTVFVAGGTDYNTQHDALYEVTVSATSSTATIESKHQMPAALAYFGCVSFKGFILIFGGETTGDTSTDVIYVFDCKQRQWRQSSIRCPKKGWCHAVLLGDNVHLIRILSGDHSVLSVPAILNGQVCSFCSVVHPRAHSACYAITV